MKDSDKQKDYDVQRCPNHNFSSLNILWTLSDETFLVLGTRSEWGYRGISKI